MHKATARPDGHRACQPARRLRLVKEEPVCPPHTNVRGFDGVETEIDLRWYITHAPERPQTLIDARDPYCLTVNRSDNV